MISGSVTAAVVTEARGDGERLAAQEANAKNATDDNARRMILNMRRWE
jgi:hypothetical protein